MQRDNEPCRYTPNCAVHRATRRPRYPVHLSRADVWEVCDMIVGGWERPDIAHWFDVSPETISNILRGKWYVPFVKEWMEHNERTDWSYVGDDDGRRDGRDLRDNDLPRGGDDR